MQEIDRRFSTSSGDLHQRCVINGMLGMGKTQLALKFAAAAFQRGQYVYVFWVSAVSVEKVTQNFAKLADRVRLPGRHRLDQASKPSAMRAWLEDSTGARSWLVVLDNVSEETVGMLRDVLPRGDCGGRLLMTTRVATIADLFTASEASSQLALQPPGIGDAVAMLSAGAKLERVEGRKEASHADAERLVRSVSNLPLAIDQAASYIRETGSKVQKVLDVYQSEKAPEVRDNNGKHKGQTVG